MSICKRFVFWALLMCSPAMIAQSPLEGQDLQNFLWHQEAESHLAAFIDEISAQFIPTLSKAITHKPEDFATLPSEYSGKQLLNLSATGMGLALMALGNRTSGAKTFCQRSLSSLMSLSGGVLTVGGGLRIYLEQEDRRARSESLLTDSEYFALRMTALCKVMSALYARVFDLEETKREVLERLFSEAIREKLSQQIEMQASIGDFVLNPLGLIDHHQAQLGIPAEKIRSMEMLKEIVAKLK